MTARLTGQRRAILDLLGRTAPRGFKPFLANPQDEARLQAFSHLIFGQDDLHPDSLRYGLQQGHFIYFGLEKKGKEGKSEIAAALALEANRGQKRLYIVEFGVAPTWRRQGLSLWLLAAVENIARRFGYRHITSHTLPENRASLALHKQVGILPVQLIKGYFHDGRDCYYMRKMITSFSSKI